MKISETYNMKDGQMKRRLLPIALKVERNMY